MKALIFGAGGQLGRQLSRTAPAAIDLHLLTRAECDITSAKDVGGALQRIRPDWVVNAAAFTSVDQAESEPDAAFGVNAVGAGNVAAASAAVGARVIHVSSDYVFDGTSSVPYREDAPLSPISVYGRSKAEGETAVRESGADAIIIRSGWLHSKDGHSFVKTILRRLQQGATANVVDDQVGVPTSASDLAGAIWWCATNGLSARTLHWVNAGVASWYELALAVREISIERGLLESPPGIYPISTAAFGAPAPRPRFSVLDARNAWELQGAPPRHWKEGVRETIAELAGEAATF